VSGLSLQKCPYLQEGNPGECKIYKISDFDPSEQIHQMYIRYWEEDLTRMEIRRGNV